MAPRFLARRVDQSVGDVVSTHAWFLCPSQKKMKVDQSNDTY